MKKSLSFFILGLLLVTCDLLLVTVVRAGGPGFASLYKDPK